MKNRRYSSNDRYSREPRRSWGNGRRKSRYGGSAGGYGRNGQSRFVGEKIGHNKYIAPAEMGATQTPYETSLKYSDFDISTILKTNLAKRNYVNPTKVQAQSIPYVVAGRDILALANTGSGKTGAFLIPMINKALSNKSSKCLIITPTRELAIQIKNEFDLFALNAGLQRVVVIGGESMRRQISSLRSNPQFVIGTPGRLKDLSQRNCLRLEQFDSIVLDEVDRMLDMGFVQDIKALISSLGKDKQSLFFSATMSKVADQIASSLLVNPVRVAINTAHSPIKNVEQNIVKVNGGVGKLQTLHNLLIQDTFDKVLVFSKTKRDADGLAKELNSRGFKVDSIHGNKSQSQRLRALASFRHGEIKILVATDVAARGIDVPDITHVINYDEPATYSDYIHRIGRTGRIGKKGVALTFVR